jgi:hypothetical protein
MSEGPTGDVILGLGRYTRCVDKAAYANPKSDLGEVLGSLIGVGAGWATLGKDACDYLLGRKLVCLGGVRCAIGTIVHIEPVGFDKSFPENIDNDFCLNLLLFPHEVEEFPHGIYPPQNKLTNWKQVTADGIQGALVLPDPTMPTPNEPSSDPTPYSATYIFGAGPPRPYQPHEDPVERVKEQLPASGNTFSEIPVMHCEFEGSRIAFVCRAMAPFFDLATGGGACRSTIGRIPLIGDAICTIVETAITIALTPLILAAIASAWEAARQIDEMLITGPVSRRVELGESVIVTGVWTWDGGHSGWNEFHATHTLQKVVLPARTTAGYPTAQAQSFVQTWCQLVAQVPPPLGKTGQPVTAMTPEQQDTYDRQQRPENQWVYHPEVDGCRPRDSGPEVPVH